MSDGQAVQLAEDGDLGVREVSHIADGLAGGRSGT
jgi:hypothetical protein